MRYWQLHLQDKTRIQTDHTQATMAWNQPNTINQKAFVVVIRLNYKKFTIYLLQDPGISKSGTIKDKFRDYVSNEVDWNFFRFVALAIVLGGVLYLSINNTETINDSMINSLQNDYVIMSNQCMVIYELSEAIGEEHEKNTQFMRDCINEVRGLEHAIKRLGGDTSQIKNDFKDYADIVFPEYKDQQNI